MNKRHGESAVAGAMLWTATRTEGPPPASAGSETTENDYRASRVQPGNRIMDTGLDPSRRRGGMLHMLFGIRRRA